MGDRITDGHRNTGGGRHVTRFLSGLGFLMATASLFVGSCYAAGVISVRYERVAAVISYVFRAMAVGAIVLILIAVAYAIGYAYDEREPW